MVIEVTNIRKLDERHMGILSTVFAAFLLSLKLFQNQLFLKVMGQILDTSKKVSAKCDICTF